MQCAIYANSKSPHCCVVNCGQDDMKMTARSQKWGLLPVMFAEPLFQVSGHKISQKYYLNDISLVSIIEMVIIRD